MAKMTMVEAINMAHAWEMDLATRSTDRVVRPFDWGLDWTAHWPFQSAEPDPETRIRELNRIALSRSARTNWKNDRRRCRGMGAGKTGADTGPSRIVIR